MRIVLVGTGTGVGKTHVACSLLRRWAARGVHAIGLKPIETGVSAQGVMQGETSDQARLLAASGTFHVKHRSVGPGKRNTRHRPSPTPASPFAFSEPISPHLAARNVGIRIDLTTIDRWVADHAAPVTVVETAGGLFSPLGSSATNLDLTLALGAHVVILVAPDRLGVLHDVTATLGLAAARGRVMSAVVLSAPAVPDASTGSNENELAALRIVRPLATFPRAEELDPGSIRAADHVIDWIES